MHLQPLALLVCLALALPGVAATADPEDGSQPETPKRVAERRHFTSVGEPGSTRPSAMYPVQGLHAEAFPVRSLGVWAEGHGFALSRRSALYDVEGGAALRLDEGIHLTASYRMLGIDLGFDADVEGADGEPGIAAPFVGLLFDF